MQNINLTIPSLSTQNKIADDLHIQSLAVCLWGVDKDCPDGGLGAFVVSKYDRICTMRTCEKIPCQRIEVGACAACRTDGYVILLEPNYNIRGRGSSPSPWGHLAFIYNALISCELGGLNNFSWDSHPWNCRIVKGALSMINYPMLIHFGSTTSQTKNWHGRSVQL